MSRKVINRIVLLFVLGMGLYHIIPSQFLIGRFIYYISLYGIITFIFFHLRYISLENKYKNFYLFASFFSIGKMAYHLWISVSRYKYANIAIEYDEALIKYQNGLINYEDALLEYNKVLMEYKFEILGIECELFASIFTAISLIILIGFSLNNKYGGMVKK